MVPSILPLQCYVVEATKRLDWLVRCLPGRRSWTGESDLKVSGDLGSWTVPPSIDDKVIRRELGNVRPYEEYVVGGGLLADLTSAARGARGTATSTSAIKKSASRRWRRRS
jgi:hypothetical protein